MFLSGTDSANQLIFNQRRDDVLAEIVNTAFVASVQLVE